MSDDDFLIAASAAEKLRHCGWCAKTLNDDDHGGNFCSFACVDFWTNYHAESWAEADTRDSDIPLSDVMRRRDNK